MKTSRLALASAAMLALSALSALSGCGGDGDLDTFCRSFNVLNQDGEDVITAQVGLEQVDILAESAPEEIRADAEVARDSYRTAVDAVEGAGLSLTALDDPTTLSPEEMDRLRTALAESDYDAQELDTAFKKVEAWAGDNC